MTTPTEPQAAATPFPEAPAPWTCKGEAFWFFGYFNPPKGYYPPQSAFSDLEGPSNFIDPAVTGTYKGGLNTIMVVRYTETPVGPYDELIWNPGNFEVPITKSSDLRITRIYVSSSDSVYNGRKNWNIPKEQAHFTFTPNPNANNSRILPYSKITVSPVNDVDNPFFSVDLTPTWILGSASLPYSTNFTPMSTTLVQPPLPQSPDWLQNGQIGTDRWWALAPVMKGKAGFFHSEGALEGGKYGNDVGFPDVKPWKTGMWLTNFELEFPVGEDLAAKSKTD